MVSFKVVGLLCVICFCVFVSVFVCACCDRFLWCGLFLFYFLVAGFLLVLFLAFSAWLLCVLLCVLSFSDVLCFVCSLSVLPAFWVLFVSLLGYLLCWLCCCVRYLWRGSLFLSQCGLCSCCCWFHCSFLFNVRFCFRVRCCCLFVSFHVVVCMGGVCFLCCFCHIAVIVFVCVVVPVGFMLFVVWVYFVFLPASLLLCSVCQWCFSVLSMLLASVVLFGLLLSVCVYYVFVFVGVLLGFPSTLLLLVLFAFLFVPFLLCSMSCALVVFGCSLSMDSSSWCCWLYCFVCASILFRFSSVLVLFVIVQCYGLPLCCCLSCSIFAGVVLGAWSSVFLIVRCM